MGAALSRARIALAGCAALTLGVLTLGLAAPATAATPTSAATPASAPTPATATAPTSAPADAAAPTPDPTTATVPIDFVTVQNGDGRFYPTVQILLGTNPDPYTVILDTGSTALVMFHDDIPGATTTDAPASVQYVGDAASGTIATADFSIGGQTASAVNFLAGTCSTSCSFGGNDLDGVLGIGQSLQVQKSASSTTTYSWYSPLRQFDDSALTAGYSLGFTEQDNVMTSGTLTLGAPAVTASTSGVVALDAGKASGHYPNALASPVYQKAVPLCWSVEDVTPLCQATTIDSGAPAGMLTGAQFAGLSDDLVADQTGLDAETGIGTIADGDSLAFSATNGAPSIASWVATRGIHKMELYNSIPDGHLNTGNAFFVGRTLSYDAASGQIFVQAGAPAPAAPATVSATPAGSGTVTALWADPAPAPQLQLKPQPSGGEARLAAAAAPVATASEALTDRLVRVRDAAGRTVQRFNLPGGATSTTITGLADGQTYTVDIASASHRGVSDYTSAVVALGAGQADGPAGGPSTAAGTTGPRLADTGAAASPLLSTLTSPIPLGLLVASILTGALLLRAARPRPTR